MAQPSPGPSSEPTGVEFRVNVSPDLVGGTYSNFVSVWHTPYEFTLDFCVLAQDGQVDPDTGRMVIGAEATARVRIPVTLLFDLLKALNGNMTKYEAKFGEIKPLQVKEESE